MCIWANFSKLYYSNVLLKVTLVRKVGNTPLPLGVGGTVHILGDGLKSMASQILSKDIGVNEINPKFY